MSTKVVIGAQWGDEGKGKIVDVLSESAEWVVRYQGGNNAGHTVEVGDEKYVLHLIPSGILHESKKAVIGHGVVLDPIGLLKEVEGLRKRGLSLEGRLLISDRTHVVLPYHKLIDAGRENTEGATKIGTTQRGIGPTYADKINRVGIRMGEFLRDDYKEVLKARFEERNQFLKEQGFTPMNLEESFAEICAAVEAVKPFITDTITLLYQAIKRGDSILFEGAQGTMLDVDCGTYPFVTSSSPTSGGAGTGTGVPPNRIEHVMGVCKAYTTRVGEGPFPTELFDDDGKTLGEVGHEFGATTGRSRRCGWFDGVVARYSVMVNGIDTWAITKLDVLDGFDTVKLCTSYEANGKTYDVLPSDIRVLEACTPIYEEHPGWKSDTTGVRSFADLPENAQKLLVRIEEITEAPIELISVGPRRAQTFARS